MGKVSKLDQRQGFLPIPGLFHYDPHLLYILFARDKKRQLALSNNRVQLAYTGTPEYVLLRSAWVPANLWLWSAWLSPRLLEYIRLTLICRKCFYHDNSLARSWCVHLENSRLNRHVNDVHQAVLLATIVWGHGCLHSHALRDHRRYKTVPNLLTIRHINVRKLDLAPRPEQADLKRGQWRIHHTYFWRLIHRCYFPHLSGHSWWVRDR